MEIYSRIIKTSEHKQIRLTVNEFNEEEFLHLREYYQDFDEEWLPAKKGIAIPLDFDSSKELFVGLSEILSLAESREVLENFFGDVIREVYNNS